MLLFAINTFRKTRFAQYHAFEDENARVKIAKNFIEAKFDKSLVVLDYLKQRYTEIDYDFTDDFNKLKKAKSIKEIMGVEGGVAYKYWNEFSKPFLINTILNQG
ncbi:CRISPR-associated endonuclease Cas1 [Methanococcoides sp. FTZ1]|uniref:CRISPR-associated endonuclease Cas1 n=1 Tax=Methanococcoides sp. FTZ1 TaxID=3439061 RepID=UPI003F83C0B9